MKTLDLINQFEETANDIQTKFAVYMFGKDCKDSGEWIGNDPSGVTDFFEGGYFFHLSDMYEVLKYGYDPNIVKIFYDYGVSYSGENREFGLNLKTFSKLYDGTDIKKWSEAYHISVLKNRKYWESDEGRAKTEADMKVLTDKFKEDISKLK